MDRKRRNSLLALSTMLLLFAGVLGVAGARTRGAAFSDAAKTRWRDYASSVKRGVRQPSPEVTSALTNAAISQNEAVVLAGEVLLWAGFGAGILAVIQIAIVLDGRRRTASRD
jgi:hypothetical protein